MLVYERVAFFDVLAGAGRDQFSGTYFGVMQMYGKFEGFPL